MIPERRSPSPRSSQNDPPASTTTQSSSSPPSSPSSSSALQVAAVSGSRPVASTSTSTSAVVSWWCNISLRKLAVVVILCSLQIYLSMSFLRTDEAIMAHLNQGLENSTTTTLGTTTTATTTTSTEEIKSSNPLTTTTTSTTATTTATTTAATSCLALNSEKWLTGPRWGNINGTDDDDDEDLVRYAKEMILDLPKALAEPGALRPYLEQTLAYNTSAWVDDTATANNTRTIRQWTTRLSYLSVMYHQHRHAMEEAQARYLPDGSISPSCQKELDEHKIGSLDFECPKAKYVVVYLDPCGIGCNIRAVSNEIFRAALTADRIVVFLNRPHVNPWTAASCHRKDYQCFFRPVSPCVLTETDIAQAYSLTKKEQRELVQHAWLPADRDQHKVWFMQTFISLHTPWKELSQYAVSSHVRTLLQHVPPQDPRSDILQVAATKMMETVTRERGYKQDGPARSFASSDLPMNHALAFYFARPRGKYMKQIDRILDSILDHVNPETSFGLPVRASDKCLKESECLAFVDYMRSTSVVWQRHQLATGIQAPPTVIFTTESMDMLHQQQAFVSNATLQAQYPMKFAFVTNSHDVTPDTGFLKGNTRYTEDEQMLSAMTSLKFQLFPRVSVLNCCSHFHQLMSDYLQEGLGKASQNTFMCQDELEEVDVSLVICCSWRRQCYENKKQKMGNQTVFLAGLLQKS